MWIAGTLWAVKQETVGQTPVAITYEEPDTPKEIILVPQTTDKVLQISPVENTWGKPSVSKPSLSEKNELVVVYRLQGKVYSKAVKKINVLRTAVLQ
jgi:hypothetical protein